MDGINKDLETLRLAGEEDSDVEYQEEHIQEEELQPFAAPERVDSHQNHMTLIKKNQEWHGNNTIELISLLKNIYY